MKVPKFDTMLNERREEYLETIGYATFDGRRSVSAPSEVYQFLRDNYNGSCRTKECVWLISVDIKNKMIGSFEISVGTVSMSLADVREIFKAALMSGAVNIILAHNHPSGDPTPSKDDVVITKKVIAAGQLLNVQLIDHVILGTRWYYSFRENNTDLFC